MNLKDLDQKIKENQSIQDADKYTELDEFKRVCLIKNLVYIDARLRKGSSREITIPWSKLTFHRNWLLKGWRAHLITRGRADYTYAKKEILIKALQHRGFHSQDSYNGVHVWLPEIPEVSNTSMDKREFAKIAFGVTDEEIDEILKGTVNT